MRTLPFSIHIGAPSSTSASDDGTVTIEITDYLSGEIIFATEMTPGRFWRLMQGLHMTLDGTTTDRPELIGMKMRNETVNISREVTGYNRNESEAAAQKWADENKKPHWDTYYVYLHNYGWAVHARWYAVPTEEELENERFTR